jgi:hypothetical protein
MSMVSACTVDPDSQTIALGFHVMTLFHGNGICLQRGHTVGLIFSTLEPCSRVLVSIVSLGTTAASVDLTVQVMVFGGYSEYPWWDRQFTS